VDILTPSATRALLDQLAHRPKRQLGQNFLVDGNIVRKSLQLAEIHRGDTVVEIGPGLGTLTTALLEAGCEVWAVERDATLFQHVQHRLVPDAGGRLHVMEGDAVQSPLAGLPAERFAAFKVVANLPYAISTPWLEAILAGPLPERMTLMLQLEAAQRFTATHGSKTFGAISIFLQSAFRVNPGHKVAAACFYPRPDVDSALLNVERLAEPFIFSAADRQRIRELFGQRRKQVGALLRRQQGDFAWWIAALEKAGLSAQSRPEEIPVPLWQRLAAGS
jgi:16S rRNA (adenine1518-N6/adenine1519-N6)-dimethyltransferase